ncbi:hypothetical protein DFQ30_009016 [Apophysomyces sp. BC1015]|nr:hypothetical protein DFQ30_009016 [Apophysomyces sp. BC1015]
MTDALGQWLLAAPESVRSRSGLLLAANTQPAFFEFVLEQRRLGTMRVDDTTLLYQEVLQNPGTAFLDLDLARGKVATTGLDMPLAMCGGFALTYTVTVSGRKLAVRCFHKESKELQQRYDAISSTLRGLRSPYFVPFDFLKSGIRIDGVGYPIVKMAWAQGTTLGEFVEQYYGDSNRLTKLIEALRKLAQYLEEQGIAHGDIQPGNVMVCADGATVQLIDYDGMFVPSLANMRSAELGHRNFQHPGRTERHFDARLDRFSFISIDLALRALRSLPQLWTITQSEAESLVFRANDFAAPASSAAFAALSRLNDCSKDAANFTAICSANISLTPSLSDFIAGRGIPTAPQYVTPTAGVQAVRAAYMAQDPVVDASNYHCVFGYVGQKVELIGKVVSVAEKKSRRDGRPYVFVNFDDWRGKCVKLAIWHEVLAKMRNKPNDSWEGRWISVKGPINSPYSSAKHGYTHLSITVSSPSLIRQITPEEARYRLAPAYRTASITTFGDGNSKLLAGLGQKSQAPTAARSATVAVHSGKPSPSQSGNQQLLEQMRNRAATSTNGGMKTATTSAARQTSSLANPAPIFQPSPRSAQNSTHAPSSQPTQRMPAAKSAYKRIPGVELSVVIRTGISARRRAFRLSPMEFGANWFAAQQGQAA